MQPIVLNDIAFQPTPKDIQHVLDTKVGQSSADAITRMIGEVQGFAKPKAMYRVVSCEAVGDDRVKLDGQLFNSRVLRVNLDEVHRAFPFVATCGEELQAWMDSIDNILDNYYADVINGMALDAARNSLGVHLEERYRLGRTACMHPGSLEDWPIQAQRPLFALIGNPEESIGVRLLDSLLMHPGQSVSGIHFQTESDFKSCQMCPREKCPNRMSPYDEELYARRFS
ncbi:MAG: vitamin B12 dependent methionine synthase [Chloroflexota bacterium]|nr:vitamin B12 dependent methionine synthase [Chloroflexota bacterium]